MLRIKKRFIVDERNRPVAVQIDIKTFEEIERLLEDYVMGQLINENDDGDQLTLGDAQSFYSELPKKE